MTRKIIAALGAGSMMALGLAGVTAASAASNGNEDAANAAELQAFQSAKVSLTDAIAAAESKTGGKALDAGFESGEKQGATYEVELVKTDGSEIYAMVDPATGAVKVQAKADDGDRQSGDADDGDGEMNDD
ncbi:MAG: PepSY domain-containing protein [Tranquillimonas sp.]|jgi:uncharacterized membrane protein YkoI